MTVEPKYATTDVNGNELSEEEIEWASRNDIDIDGFEKFNWKTAESRDEWDEVLVQMSRAKRLAEWKSVLSDKTDRKAAIIHVTNTNREDWLKRVGSYGLAYRDIRYTSPSNGFSHRFHPTSPNDPERVTYAVIAKNEDVADKMEEAELEMSGKERHDTVGTLLNFPECCRDFFYEHFIDRGMKDYIYEMACNSESAKAVDGDRTEILIQDTEPLNNVIHRYFGHSFLTHIPCSFNCGESTKVAENRGEIMAENGYREAANRMYQWLSLPTVWTGNNSLAHVKNRHMIGSAATGSYWEKKKVVFGKENMAGGSIIEE